jgi:hypothetical protein
VTCSCREPAAFNASGRFGAGREVGPALLQPATPLDEEVAECRDALE